MRTSPTTTLRLPKKDKTASRRLSPIPEPNINVTASTPPAQEAELPDEHQNQPPSSLWLSGVSTDLRSFVNSALSSPGIHEEDRGRPKDDSWHSREPTRVGGARPDSGVGGLVFEGPDKRTTDTGLHPIKSEVSLAEGLTSGVNVSASIGTAGETREKRPDKGTMGWLRSRLPKKSSTQMSGAAEFEEAWEERHSDDGKEPDTDVLEVWFAGCHSGMFLLSRFSAFKLIQMVDVGGGSDLNTAKYSLSNISLRW